MTVIQAPVTTLVPHVPDLTTDPASSRPIATPTATVRQRFRDRGPTVRPIARAAVGSAILIAVAMLLIFGLLPAALVAAGS